MLKMRCPIYPLIPFIVETVVFVICRNVTTIQEKKSEIFLNFVSHAIYHFVISAYFTFFFALRLQKILFAENSYFLNK